MERREDVGYRVPHPPPARGETIADLDASAHYHLGLRYEHGEGYERNRKRAFEHYLHAALMAVREAVDRVGHYYFFGYEVGEDRRFAQIWWDVAAKPEAQPTEQAVALYHRAMHELTTDSGKRSQNAQHVKRGLIMLDDAAQLGMPLAMFALARINLEGFDEKSVIDVPRGVELLRRSAGAGFADGAFYLARCYERGQLLEKNDLRAFEWYVRAALRGNAQAYGEVTRCYRSGVGTREDRWLAAIWAAH